MNYSLIEILYIYMLSQYSKSQKTHRTGYISEQEPATLTL